MDEQAKTPWSEPMALSKPLELELVEGQNVVLHAVPSDTRDRTSADPVLSASFPLPTSHRQCGTRDAEMKPPVLSQVPLVYSLEYRSQLACRAY